MSNSLRPHGLYSTWNSSGQNSLSLLQGIFPTRGLNPGLLHCRQILYCLNHQKSPRILEWVAYSFSRGSLWPRNPTGVSCIGGRFFTSWATREALSQLANHLKTGLLKSSFWTVVLEKTLESPSDCKEIQPVHPEGDQSWLFIGRTDAEAETNTLATWFEELTHLKRLLRWERLKAGGEGEDRGQDGWMASPT